MTLARAFLAAALILVLGACAYMAPYQPPSTYYVMRHLHTPEGAADPGLTEEGQRHARLLADFFTEEPPATIFVSTTKRARQTAAPLAAKLGITPRLYDPRDTAGLITEVMKEPPPVLIVGHSNTVPDIVAALGGERPEPLVHEDFGDVWKISGSRRVTTRVNLGD
ncbi:SixA phosphatase family protein [Allosphingosinicella sp.]|uniref:SixA phosphatase family protein n=1 Tax=Allosphingosinicella sp. TaxID=2823234 RepID=UPI002FC168CF